MPHPTASSTPRFGFIVHPLTAFQRRLVGVRSADLRLAIRGQTVRPPARVVARLKLEDGLGATAQGILVTLPHLPEELLADQEAGVEAVVAAARLCEAEGADVIGLGAVAAVIGGQGKAVARAIDTPVTTGNALTSIAAMDTLRMLRRMGVGTGRVGLLGPPGPVATAILTQLVRRQIPVDVVSARPPKPLQRLVSKLDPSGQLVTFVPDSTSVLAQGRALIAASSTGGRLRLSELPPRSVVIDVAAPVDVLHDCRRRSDVLIVDGEYIRLPQALGGSLWRKIYGLVTQQDRHLFACFAEPMLLAAAERADLCSVGRSIPAERLDGLANLAAERGYWVDRLHEAGQQISAARLRNFVR